MFLNRGMCSSLKYGDSVFSVLKLFILLHVGTAYGKPNPPKSNKLTFFQQIIKKNSVYLFINFFFLEGKSAYKLSEQI